MPDLSSNNPFNIFYGAVFSELLRIGRATLLFDDIVPRVLSYIIGCVYKEDQKPN